MRNRFFIICVAVIIFNASLNTLVNVNETRKSTDKIEQAINKETEEKKDEENAPVINNNITIHGDYNDNTITDSYNNTTDTSTSDTDVYNDNRTEEEDNTEDIIEDNTINNNTDSRYNENNNNDYWQVPAVEHKTVLNKNLECPKCGAYAYSERYNPDLLKYYFGVCSTCHSENSDPDIVKR